MNRAHLRMETTMHTPYDKARSPIQWLMLLAVLALMLFASTRTFGAEAKQTTFATPEDAAAALVAAAKTDDANAIRAILGSKPGELSSGDPVADRALRAQFAASYEEKHALVASGDAMTLTIGSDGFPFAFPLVKAGDRWKFDSAAGKDELMARRIGQNELYAIKVMQAIVDAQREYASEDRNGDGVLAYATKFMSSKGKRDGLYWPTKAGEAPSPLGSLIVSATAEGYRAKDGKPTAYHGYYYRMLKGQAKSASSPAFDYVVRGRAIGGFAVVAYPAKYGSSGIMTFMVNQDGKVYQADLGPNTQAKATAMQKFDPGSGWSPVATP
ncbi:MAG: DUF2950 domain-containing protein [Burkholderiales bacterium]